MKKSFALLLILFLLTGCQKQEVKEDVNFASTKQLQEKKNVFEYGDLIKFEDVFEDENIIFEDKYLDTTTLGDNNIKLKYKKDNNIYETNFSYVVVDTTNPLIWSSGTYTITQGEDINLQDKIICTDNHDSNPNCTLNGNYDTSTPGTYKLTMSAKDESGNSASTEVTLKVNPKPVEVKKEVKKQVPITTNEENPMTFANVLKEYKTEDNIIGIDVSRYQEKIDWKKVKEDGVQFAIIRLGYQNGLHSKELGLDKYYLDNIKGAQENNIPVGIYFYSYATTKEEAIEQANFVLENIKGYNITLPIAFDWENFSKWSEINISLTELRSISYAFQDTIYNAGYTPAQYGSKNYLKAFWNPPKYETWVAHYLPFSYTTDYQGDYIMWQMCNTGKVNGINGDVDLDIYYNKKRIRQ